MARLYSFEGVGLAIAFATLDATVGDYSPPSAHRFLYAAAVFSTAVVLNFRLLYGRWTRRPWLVGLLVFALFLVPPDDGDDLVALVMLVTLLLAVLMQSPLRAMASMVLAFFGVVIVGTVAAMLTAIYMYRESIVSNIAAGPRTAQFVEALQEAQEALRSENGIENHGERPRLLRRGDDVIQTTRAASV